MTHTFFFALTDAALVALAQSLSGGAGGGGGESPGVFLLSWWKPLLVFVPFAAWAWVVATIYDKDAIRWYFNRRAWNTGHLVAGLVAVAAALFAPSFVIGWPVMLVILGGDLGLYFVLRNKDDRVPKHEVWRLDLSSIKERRAARKQARVSRGVELTLRGPSGPLNPPEKDTPEHEVRVAAESILIEAMESRAAQFTIAPVDQNTSAVAYLIDGVRRTGETLPQQRATEIINLLKTAAGLDISDYRRRLRADLAVERAGARRTLRITTSGSSAGLQLRGVFDPEDQVRFTIDELGLLPNQKEAVDSLVADGTGTVLIGAPPQGGRTATLYALVRAHDAYTSNVQTIELEPQGALEGVRQNQFDPAAEGGEYSTTVRSLLRRDPSVLAVAELPDAATAQEVAKADHSRTRTYVGLRADNSLTAIQAFVKAVGDAEMGGKAIHGVIAQRLLRKLCPNCRVEYQPAPDMVKKLGAQPGQIKSLYRKGGQVMIKNKPETCPMCQGVGYYGQEGVFEVFPIDEEDRALIANSDLAGLRASLRKKRLPSIQEAAILKAVEGVTAVEEVARVTQSGQSGGNRPAQQQKKQPAKAAGA